MKKLMIKSLMTLTLLGAMAQASAGTTTKFSGSGTFDLWRSTSVFGSGRSPIASDVDALVVQTDNGRAMINLSIKGGVKGCQGFGRRYYAEEDGFGGYSLYQSKEDWMAANTAGTATIESNTLTLTIIHEFEDQYACEWTLNNTVLSLKAANPIKN